MNLVGQGDPERLEGAAVTAICFRCWACSRLWDACSPPPRTAKARPAPLLLSYQLWQAVFGGDAGVIGRHVNLDNEPYAVIGVMPRDFHFPSRDAEFWTPMRFQEHSDDFRDRNNNYLNVVARLKPGRFAGRRRARR